MRKSLAIIVGFMLVSVGSLRAQDAAAVNPKTIHVTLDNEHARVFEATLTPGWKENMHSHPVSIVYVIDDSPDCCRAEAPTVGQYPLVIRWAVTDTGCSTGTRYPTPGYAPGPTR